MDVDLGDTSLTYKVTGGEKCQGGCRKSYITSRVNMADVGLSVLDQGRENLGLSSLSCKHCLPAARDKVTGADSAQMYRYRT